MYDWITYDEIFGAKPYRFVFIDSCFSAAGDWPSAFGVGTATYTDTSWYLGVFNTSHIRPSAFVGWATVIGGPAWGTAVAGFNFRAYWMGYWSMTSPALKDAITAANQASGWVSQGQLDSSLRIFGYENMGMEDYNHKGDWNYP